MLGDFDYGSCGEVVVYYVLKWFEFTGVSDWGLHFFI